MIILGIETSCDETAAAVVLKDHNGIQILSNIMASSAKLQEKFGGIIPEQAAREQIKTIIPVIKESIQGAGCRVQDLDAIAVTKGPGLIGSLLVGVETAKTLSLIWKKPLIPVNHLLGHFWANWIQNDVSSSKYHVLRDKKDNTTKDSHNTKYIIHNTPKFPCLGLLVSGGHTDLVIFKNHNKYEYLGGTRDDAAGECFDKCARLLGLPYPGGPEISKLASKGDPNAYKLPRPMIDSNDFDFSFSGLKTAVSNLVDSSQFMVHGKNKKSKNHQLITNNQLANLCASIEQAIIDSLVKKATKAGQIYNIEQLIVAGGVASNLKLKQTLRAKFAGKVFTPPPYLCTDNASMIASRAFFEKPIKNPLGLQANPSLSLSP